MAQGNGIVKQLIAAKGLGPNIDAVALPDGYLAEALNCFYDSWGALRMWRPAFTKVLSLGSGPLAIKVFPDDNRVVAVFGDRVDVKALDGTLITSYALPNTASKGAITRSNGAYIVGTNTNPALAITVGGVVYEIGAHLWADASKKASGTTITANGTTTVLSYIPAHGTKKRISFITLWLARDIYTTGQLQAQVRQGASTWTSDNLVLVGALPYSDSTTKEFYEAYFTFSNCEPNGTDTIYVDLVASDLNHPDSSPVVYMADIQGSAQTSGIVSSIVAINTAIRINGRTKTDGYDRAASAFDRVFLASSGDTKILVSNVRDFNDFDYPGGGGFLSVDFNPTAILPWHNAILISGVNKLNAYTGTWPDYVERSSQYTNWVANTLNWVDVDQHVFTVTDSRLIAGSPLNFSGAFAWQSIKTPWDHEGGVQYNLFYMRPLQLLLVSLSSGKLYAMQLATGQWCRWDIFESTDEQIIDYAAYGDSTYVSTSAGDVYTVAFDGGTGYETILSFPSVYLGPITEELDRILCAPALPDGTLISIQSKGAYTTGTASNWTYSLQLDGIESDKANEVIPLVESRPIGYQFDVSLTIPASATRTTSDSFKALSLVLYADSEEVQLGDI